jgi:hypothetical protein
MKEEGLLMMSRSPVDEPGIDQIVPVVILEAVSVLLRLELLDGLLPRGLSLDPLLVASDVSVQIERRAPSLVGRLLTWMAKLRGRRTLCCLVAC